MKTFCLFWALTLALALSPAVAQSKRKAADDLKLQPGESVIVERGPHHRVWKQARVATLPDGTQRTNLSSFTELGSGLHRWDGQNQQWVDAEAKLEIVGNNAIGRSAAHQVIFKQNANTAGAIDLLTPDGKRLRSHVLGLAFFDAATGQSEMIAELKDSAGELHAPNVVIYPDAFDRVKCDLRYTYRLGGFEQDIILKENPALPKGFNADTTRLEVWTEFIESPEPAITQRGRAGMTDDTLDFGEMKTGAGKAFALGDEPNTKNGAPVAKRWLTIEGRTFLIEAARFLSAKPTLDKLPAAKGNARVVPPAGGKPQLDRRFPAAPPVRQARGNAPGEKFRVAQVGKPVRSLAQASSGLVLDYNLLSSYVDFVFQADTTYYVSDAVGISGTATFEGGCVVKYSASSSASLNLSGTVVWNTAPYHPAVFTAVDDQTVGAFITEDPIAGYYGGTYLTEPGTPQHVRISYARTALQVGADLTVRHAQILNCEVAMQTDVGSAQTVLENVLLQNITTIRICASGGTPANYGKHLTVNTCEYFSQNASIDYAYFQNCIFADSGWGTTTPTLTTSVELSEAPVFQVVGAGQHYLAANSPYRNAGSTLSGTLSNDIRQLTTYPPIVLNGLITNSLVLSPQAQRDTDVPDLGYHYTPLDYAFGNAGVSNATVVATGGVAICTYSAAISGYGLGLHSNCVFISEGSPTALNRIVRYNTVQEQVNAWEAFPGPQVQAIVSPQARFRFTEFSMLAYDTDHFRGYWSAVGSFPFADCSFTGGRNNTERPEVNFTNCVFVRVNNELTGYDHALTASYQNCLFRGGQLYFEDYMNSGPWVFKNNLFDATIIVTNDVLVTNSFNAYTTNIARLVPYGASNLVLSLSSVPFVPGPFGKYYLPTNGVATNLFNAGSTNAHLLGFYHYTTTTNQVKEATTRLDLGFHYVAVNASGQPIDTDGDGLPDYLEDGNGNGSLDTGETGWASGYADTDGDGVSDLLELLLGRNPTGAGATNDVGNLVNLRVFSPLK